MYVPSWVLFYRFMEETLTTAIAIKPARRMLSRDEMNLAEFPLTVLSTRSNPNVKTLEFQDTVISKSGQAIRRKWVITSADKFGLPTASDDEVLLGLLKLTVDDGICSRKIFFTRYELLRILRWTTEGRSYTRLQNALDRLSGVRVKATNAFYDNESKSHSTKNFGIIDAYEINDGREASVKPSFFIWSEEIFHSFQVGFIKKFDLDFYLELRSAVSKRLYRYLDKRFWYKSSATMNLFILAHEKIGISRTYQYASLIRQQLDPAIEELVQRGFLSHAEYAGKGRNMEITLYAANGARRNRIEDSCGAQQTLPAEHDQDGERRELAPLLQKIVQRGIKPAQAERLLCSRGPQELERIEKIVDYYDRLVQTGSRLVSRSPVGFLYKAIENAASFVLPDDTDRAKRRPQAGPPRQGSAPSAADKLRERYLAERSAALKRLRADIEPALMADIREEVAKGLLKVKKLISTEHYEQAVEHGVEEKMARLFALPDFEEWHRGRQH